MDVDEGENEAIAARITVVLDRIERAPKSRSWRLRARVGERVRWVFEQREAATSNSTDGGDGALRAVTRATP